MSAIVRFWTTISQEPGQCGDYQRDLDGCEDAQGGTETAQPYGCLPPSLQRLEKGEVF